MPETGPGFGLYIHWPYCASKCPYCDFNSHVGSNIDHAAWAKAYGSELARYREITGQRVVDSLFFGGGTPSLMTPEMVAEVIACVDTHWKMAADVEITLEANPTSIEVASFRDFRSAGINRVSIGVQALDDPDLERLGRKHSANEALAAIERAQDVFQRVSFDLIYARQDQTVSAWQNELRRAARLGTEHLSLYQLTVERGTVFGRRHATGGLPGLPDEDLSADLFEVTQEICREFLLPAYEVSNHAKTGAESRHNLIYWRGGDYLGIGPGAHGRLNIDGERFATEAIRQPDAWLASTILGCGDRTMDPLSVSDRLVEYVMMSLRLSEGLAFDRLAEFGQLPAFRHSMVELIGEGFLRSTKRGVCTTPKGRLVLNALTSRLLRSVQD